MKNSRRDIFVLPLWKTGSRSNPVAPTDKDKNLHRDLSVQNLQVISLSELRDGRLPGFLKS